MNIKKFLSFTFEIKNNKLKKEKFYSLYYVENEKPRIILLKNEENIDKIILLKDKIFGISKYKFRKGVGIKSGIHKLKLKSIENKYIEFYTYKKEKKILKINKNDILKVPINETKYIYPFIVSPNIKEKLDWNNTYIIFPYEYGNKYPINPEKFKNEAPTLFKYLKKYEKILDDNNSYNKRIQDKKYFYGLIRVGKYTYNDIFVAMRDNTKVVSSIVHKITTHWNEEKIPIFDSHISYLSMDLENNPLTLNKAKKINKVINNPLIKDILEGFFDARSIGTRLPIKIEELENIIDKL